MDSQLEQAKTSHVAQEGAVVVTSCLLEAFLACPIKCYLLSKGEIAVGSDYTNWVATRTESYRSEGIHKVTAGHPHELGIRSLESGRRENVSWHFALDQIVRIQDWEASLQVVQRVPLEGTKSSAKLVPIRFVPANKLTSSDKMLNYTGWKTRKNPAEGEFFFLTFPFIELIRTWRVGRASTSKIAADHKAGCRRSQNYFCISGLLQVKDRAMALYASRYFEEVHMQVCFAVLIAMFDAVFTLAIVILAVVAAYLGHRVIHGIRVYFRLRGTTLVTCPETHEAAVVGVAARSMGMQAILGEPCLRLRECSRWPKREGCGQDCLRQIEARPSELRIPSAWRAS